MSAPAPLSDSLPGLPQVLVLVCGSVAAIKAPATLRRLREAGARTEVIATRAALEFVTPLSLSAAGACPGIAADQLEKLFDRFYRLEDSRSRDRGGAGLGLSIARTIVDAHGGRIWLESRPGHGTQAYVDLPVGNLPALDDDDIP